MVRAGPRTRRFNKNEIEQSRPTELDHSPIRVTQFRPLKKGFVTVRIEFLPRDHLPTYRGPDRNFLAVAVSVSYTPTLARKGTQSASLLAIPTGHKARVFADEGLVTC
jgi:hypothetical protein